MAPQGCSALKGQRNETKRFAGRPKLHCFIYFFVRRQPLSLECHGKDCFFIVVPSMADSCNNSLCDSDEEDASPCDTDGEDGGGHPPLPALVALFHMVLAVDEKGIGVCRFLELRDFAALCNASPAMRSKLWSGVSLQALRPLLTSGFRCELRRCDNRISRARYLLSIIQGLLNAEVIPRSWDSDLAAMKVLLLQERKLVIERSQLLSAMWEFYESDPVVWFSAMATLPAAVQLLSAPELAWCGLHLKRRVLRQRLIQCISVKFQESNADLAWALRNYILKATCIVSSSAITTCLHETPLPSRLTDFSTRASQTCVGRLRRYLNMYFTTLLPMKLFCEAKDFLRQIQEAPLSSISLREIIDVPAPVYGHATEEAALYQLLKGVLEPAMQAADVTIALRPGDTFYSRFCVQGSTPDAVALVCRCDEKSGIVSILFAISLEVKTEEARITDILSSVIEQAKFDQTSVAAQCVHSDVMWSPLSRKPRNFLSILVMPLAETRRSLRYLTIGSGTAVAFEEEKVGAVGTSMLIFRNTDEDNVGDVCTQFEPVVRALVSAQAQYRVSAIKRMRACGNMRAVEFLEKQIQEPICVCRSRDEKHRPFRVQVSPFGGGVFQGKRVPGAHSVYCIDESPRYLEEEVCAYSKRRFGLLTAVVKRDVVVGVVGGSTPVPSLAPSTAHQVGMELEKSKCFQSVLHEVLTKRACVSVAVATGGVVFTAAAMPQGNNNMRNIRTSLEKALGRGTAGLVTVISSGSNPQTRQLTIGLPIPDDDNDDNGDNVVCAALVHKNGRGERFGNHDFAHVLFIPNGNHRHTLIDAKCLSAVGEYFVTRSVPIIAVGNTDGKLLLVIDVPEWIRLGMGHFREVSDSDAKGCFVAYPNARTIGVAISSRTAYQAESMASTIPMNVSMTKVDGVGPYTSTASDKFVADPATHAHIRALVDDSVLKLREEKDEGARWAIYRRFIDVLRDRFGYMPMVDGDLGVGPPIAFIFSDSNACSGCLGSTGDGRRAATTAVYYFTADAVFGGRATPRFIFVVVAGGMIPGIEVDNAKRLRYPIPSSKHPFLTEISRGMYRVLCALYQLERVPLITVGRDTWDILIGDDCKYPRSRVAYEPLPSLSPRNVTIGADDDTLITSNGDGTLAIALMHPSTGNIHIGGGLTTNAWGYPVFQAFVAMLMVGVAADVLPIPRNSDKSSFIEDLQKSGLDPISLQMQLPQCYKDIADSVRRACGNLNLPEPRQGKSIISVCAAIFGSVKGNALHCFVDHLVRQALPTVDVEHWAPPRGVILPCGQNSPTIRPAALSPEARKLVCKILRLIKEKQEVRSILQSQEIVRAAPAYLLTLAQSSGALCVANVVLLVEQVWAYTKCADIPLATYMGCLSLGCVDFLLNVHMAITLNKVRGGVCDQGLQAAVLRCVDGVATNAKNRPLRPLRSKRN